DQTSKLGAYKDGKNFDYSLGTVGMSASAKSGKYTLEMPSYADGRICCSDIETGACNNLNKNYPLCSDLVDTSKTPDYVAGNEECGIEIEKEKETPTAGCELSSYTKTCQEEGYGSNYTGSVTYTVNETCTGYERKDTCVAKACTLKDYKAPCPQDSKHYIYYTVNGQCEYDRDASACEGCSNDPDDCPGGYWNNQCYCITCKESRGVKVNASRTACESIISKEECIAAGKVYMEIIEGEIYPLAVCAECDSFYERTGKSKDGTIAGCEKDESVCPLKYSDCAKRGGQWLNVYANHLKKDCECMPCSLAGYPEWSTSASGSGSDCTGYQCNLTEADCAARGGLVLNTKLDGSCECVPCSRFWPGEGTTATGNYKDCSNCTD
ncbi:MAG: hypothetical protein IJ876_03360, partial [Elusimicrobiaceae bacterium]|nr:hypothetical protein [Elusimicrobiaceae bacterium]